MFLIIN